MGGGDRGLYQNTAGSKSRGDRLNSLFSNEASNDYLIIGQSGSSVHAGYASENIPPFFSEPIQDEVLLDTFFLFIVMCYFLTEKFGDTKNKRLTNFLNRFEVMETMKRGNLIASSEFKSFQKYCKNKSTQQHHGYEVVRRFMTKYFSDSSGSFMRLNRDGWEQYVNRFLEKNNFGR